MKRRHQRTALALIATGTLGGTALAGTPAFASSTPLRFPTAAAKAVSLKAVAIPAVTPRAAAAGAATPTVVATGKVVTDGIALNARSGPSVGSLRTGTIADGTTVSIVCKAAGQFISGTVKNTGFWDRLSDNSFISDAFVQRREVEIPKCTSTAPLPAISGAWMLPVSAGLVSDFRTAQRPAHDGVDLGATRDTPIRAASSGTVIQVVCNVSKGSCDTDGSPSLRGCGWYVEVLHAGNIVTRYCHMVRRPSVTLGQTVARGSILGYVGTSGSSSGPHLHFEVHVGVPATRENAFSPIAFMRDRGLTIK
ncbi:peptidoglycan DD-metalloendopeptidase family protein [Actinoplanes sp. NPDC051346]|uniref:peptidoglycan DD-metalloendopeptidase family protein n=1 Tax=Actinoplanes sp. NPDC051346 TaxID=3155048 RepID=UPI00341B83D9